MPWQTVVRVTCDADPSGMNITGISSSSGQIQQLQQFQSQQAQRGRRADTGGPIAAVASTLGLSVDDITAQVKAGKSLSDIATAQGVSHEDLIAALKAGAPEEMKATATDDSFEKIAADTTLGRVGGAGRGHRPPPPDSGVTTGNLTSSQSTMLDSLSSLLGTDSSSLLSSLQSGTDLSSLLSSKNIDAKALADVIEKGFMVDARA